MPMCDNDTDLYNSGAVHHLRDQSPVTQGNHNLQICSLHKSVIWWEIVARSELQCLGQDELCGHGAVECSVGRWGYVAIVTIIRGPAEKIIRTTLLRPSF